MLSHISAVTDARLPFGLMIAVGAMLFIIVLGIVGATLDSRSEGRPIRTRLSRLRPRRRPPVEPPA